MNSVLLVNAEKSSAIGHRAQALAPYAREQGTTHLMYRSGGKIASAYRMWQTLRRTRPDVVYVFDPGYSGVAASLAFRAETGTPVAIEFGDAIYCLAKASGMRGPFGLAATWLLERAALYGASRVVVRGTKHVGYLAKLGISARHLPDGLSMDQFRPLDAAPLRRKLGLERCFVIGMVGSMVWNEKAKTCYGLEVIETLRLLPDPNIKALLVGDGDGFDRLQHMVKAYGLEQRVVFTGRLPLAELPLFINAMDVCISTQSNNLAGQVRTTGKLPLYLACGRFVLSTDVGEASCVLPSAMLLPYSGEFDPAYPARLAERIAEIRNSGQWESAAADNRHIAAEHFDYALLGRRFQEILRSTARIAKDRKSARWREAA